MTTQTKTTWRRVKLGELNLDISDGNYSSKYPAKTDFAKGGVPFIRADNFQNGRISWTDMHFITPKKHKELQKGHLKKNDILITTRGEIGKIAYINNDDFIDANINAQVVRINTGGKIYPRFFFYSLLRKSRSGFFQNIQTGTALQQLPVGVLKGVEIDLPDVTTQKRIADILSAFDDKIELNNKISRTLEQMAQTIFKEWFVNFKFPGHEKVKMIDSGLGKIPEGWEIKNLGEVADVQWGDTSITKASYIEKGYLAYIASGPDGYREKYDFDRIGVVLSAIGANCGLTWLARDKWSAIKNTLRFWSSDDKISTEYLFLATQRKETWPQRGSAQPFIALGDARKRKILIPAEGILKQFNYFVVDAYSKIDRARLENQKLSALRDLLLPKLMSGEIKV